MKVTGIILAGGKGERLKSITQDKIMLRIGAGAVLTWSVANFTQSGIFDQLIITYRDDQQKEIISNELKSALKDCLPITWVQGGERRQDSVQNALEAIADDIDFVFIHDGARPFITRQDLNGLFEAVQKTGGASLAKPVTDTIKRSDKSGSLEELQLEDLERPRLYAMETPQVFRFKEIRNAYRAINKTEKNITDCVAAYNSPDQPVSLVLSEQNNLKITNPSDVEIANFLIHTGSIKKVFELAYT